jgi:TolA-binding protein
LRYVASRLVVLSYQTAEPAAVQTAELWVSTDCGRHWTQASAAGPGATAVSFTAPSDGWYSFHFVLRNKSGASAEHPASGLEPHATVVVDTVTPTLQLHDAHVSTTDDARRTLGIQLSLIDENLGDGGMRLFHRTSSSATWCDGGPVAVDAGSISWEIPQNVGSEIDVRLVATDLAGNRASEEILGVSTMTVGPTSQPASPPADRSTRDRVAPSTVEPLVVRPVQPPVVDPVAQVETHDRSAPPPPQPSPAESNELQHLRRLAERHMAEGRHALAAARLEDALNIAPDDVDLLVAHGGVLYRTGRHAEAKERFQSTLKTRPDHPGAIEGLALVAVTQRRYPEARAHLRHLLDLNPESAKTWLRYGDIEHKLGNRDEALKAWQQVLAMRVADRNVRDGARVRLKYFGPPRRDSRP